MCEECDEEVNYYRKQFEQEKRKSDRIANDNRRLQRALDEACKQQSRELLRLTHHRTTD